MGEKFIVRKGEWYFPSHKNNPTDEEVLAFSKSLSESCPALVQRRYWSAANSDIITSYEVFTEFEVDDDPIYMRMKIAGIAGWMPIELPK